MRNSFALTEKANVILLKILKTFLFVTILILCIVSLRHFSTDLLYLLFAIAIIDIIALLNFKSYKVVGRIIFEKNEILIEKNNRKIQLAFQSILRIKLILHGRRRRSYLPVIYAPIGMNMADGTGNLIEIDTVDNMYKFDIFLTDSFDENSLAAQIKRLSDLGLKIEKRKLPVILGDSI